MLAKFFLRIRLFTCFAVFILFIPISCNAPLPPANRVFVIQPFFDFPPVISNVIYKQFMEVNPKTILRKAVPLPVSSYYAPRNRYRADAIIDYLDNFGNADTVIIGLTSHDISAAKGKIPEWGVMGLGFEPGNACVVSTFRLSRSHLYAQYIKIALHELGHTQGLPHCANVTCLMRDARGGNHLDEETGFCARCKSFLQSKGWTLK